MELLAPLLLALLFVVFGLSYRHRGGCASCPGKGDCGDREGCRRRQEPPDG